MAWHVSNSAGILASRINSNSFTTLPLYASEPKAAAEVKAAPEERDPPAPAPLDREALLRKVFASCDDDGSGALSVAEFAQLAASQSEIAMAMQEAVFAMVDANTDSTLSVDEFVKFNLANGEGLDDAEFAAQVAQWQALADARLVLKRGTNYLSFVEATLLPNLGAHLRSVLERLAGVETAAAPPEEEEGEEY